MEHRALINQLNAVMFRTILDESDSLCVLLT